MFLVLIAFLQLPRWCDIWSLYKVVAGLWSLQKLVVLWGSCCPISFPGHAQLPFACAVWIPMHIVSYLIPQTSQQKQNNKQKHAQSTDNTCRLTAFCIQDSSPHLPVTPAQLMRSGIGRNASCAVGDFVSHLGIFLRWFVVC